MKRISSKYLNLEGLSFLIEKSETSNCALLLTNFGYVIGDLDLNSSDDDNASVAYAVALYKSKVLESDSEDLELINDGSLISIKNAIVKYSNNMTLNFKELTIHSNDVVGFAPINRDEILSQLS